MSVSKAELDLTHGSLELTGKSEKIFKGEDGKAYEFLGFFFVSGKFVDSFVAQESDVVRPVTHRLGENALFNEVVYRTFKPKLTYFAVGKVKEFFEINLESFFKNRSASHNGQRKIVLGCAECFLHLTERLPNLFRDMFFVVNRRRLGVNAGYQNLMASPFSNEFFKSPGLVASDKAGDSDNGFVAFGTLSKDGVATLSERRGVCRVFPRKNVVAVEDNVPETVGTFYVKNQH